MTGLRLAALPLAIVCLALMPGAAPAAEMMLTKVSPAQDAEDYLWIDGPIEAGDSLRFMKQLKAHPELDGVALSSDGGSLDDGLAIAKQIYERQLDTMLFASCHSICSVMFLAGEQKYVPANFQLTVHSAYKEIAGYTAVDNAANGTVAWFLGHMGYPLPLAGLWMSTKVEDAAPITWAMNDKWSLGLKSVGY